MTSFSENVKYVNKNCKYYSSNDLRNYHMKECHYFMDHPVYCDGRW